MERIEGNMLYTVPHYYRKFQCTASACTDTCCAGWQIMIDDKSLRKYREDALPDLQNVSPSYRGI